jgi:hypothetical protein
MTTFFVQFEDDKELKIVSVFGNEQDADVYPNQGVVAENDPRYLAFINPPPVIVTNPLDKLKAFLLANPDVAAILE